MVPDPNMSVALDALRASFVGRLPGRLSSLAELHVALGERGDVATIREMHRQAHGLAGTAGTFGFAAVADAASALEGQLEPLLERAPETEDLVAIEQAMARLSDPDGAAPSADEAPSAMEVPLAPASASERSLLYIVEDEDAQRAHISQQLEHFGYEVQGFSSAAELVGAERMPAAVLMDLALPEGALAGAEAAAELRERLGGDVPVMFLSVRGDTAARLAAVRAGGDAYMTKPFDAVELLDKLERMIGAHDEAPLRVLVVDDEPEQRERVLRILGGSGMDVTTAADAEEALEALASVPVDLILLDFHLPGCTGDELARMIRQDDRCAAIPITFLSTEACLRKQLAALSVGGDDFLVKPLGPAELVSRVRIRARRGRRLAQLISRDPLTGLLNHGHIKRKLAMLLGAQNGEPLSLALIDIDDFKRVNDTHGHTAGDRVLKCLARMLSERLRGRDVVGRYGGEEILVLMPGATAAIAQQRMSDILDSFSEVVQRGAEDFHVTFSGGVSERQPGSNARELFEAADRALYAAKAAGKARIYAL